MQEGWRKQDGSQIKGIQNQIGGEVTDGKVNKCLFIHSPEEYQEIGHSNLKVSSDYIKETHLKFWEILDGVNKWTSCYYRDISVLLLLSSFSDDIYWIWYKQTLKRCYKRTRLGYEQQDYRFLVLVNIFFIIFLLMSNGPSYGPKWT